MPTAVSDLSWTDDVLLSDRPVLVTFTADWCPPCRTLKPILREIEDELDGRVRVVTLDTDANPDAARDYGVLSLPTLALFRDGELIQAVIGLRPKRQLLAMVEDALSTARTP
jgi:thioredoxin